MNISRSKIMRLCASFLTSLFLVGALPWRELRADANTHGEYNCDPLSVVYEQSSSWETTTMGEFTITNTSDYVVDGWKFELVFASELSITNLWNGQDVREEDTPSNILIIGNELYNAVVEPGASVSFGIIMTGSEFSPVAPSEVRLITDEVIDESSEPTAESETEPTVDESTPVPTITPSVTPSETTVEDEADATVTPEPTETPESELITPTPIPVDEEIIEDPYSDIDYELDTDGDMVPDYYEEQIGSNPNDPDTDGDGLNDVVELLLSLDPTLTDTDGNGILDAEEDPDDDGLSILEELNYGTSPVTSDTDLDTIFDGDEINIYGTDPLYYDSDSDGISDSDEILLGKDPLDESDYQVLVEQTMTTEINNEDDPAITSVDLKMSITGVIDYSVYVNDVYGSDFYMTDVEGRIGSPISIDTSEEFDSAEVTINYNEDLLGEISEENLGVLCYDDNTGSYELIEQADLDLNNNSVTFNVNSFSSYILVDVNSWNAAMPHEYTYDELFYSTSDEQHYDVFFAFNISSDVTSDERAMILETMNRIIRSLDEEDRFNFVAVDHGGSHSYYNSRTLMWNRSEYSSVPGSLRTDIMNMIGGSGASAIQLGAEGTSNFYAFHPQASIGNQVIVINLTDDSINDRRPMYLLGDGSNLGYHVYTIFTPGSFSQSASDYTVNAYGGSVFTDCTDPNIFDQIMAIEQNLRTDDSYGTSLTCQDDDNDGIPDVIERDGIYTFNRSCKYISDPTMADTDGDSIPDGEELGEGYLIWRLDDNTVNINGSLIAISDLSSSAFKFLEPYVPSESGKVCYVSKMSNNPGSSDSNSNGISDYFDTSGDIIYIFYGEDSTYAFENEANFRERWCQEHGYEYVKKQITTTEDFIENWNNMGVKDGITYWIDSVFVISHAAWEPTTTDTGEVQFPVIYLSAGQEINTADIDTSLNQPRTITNLYLNACYLGQQVPLGSRFTTDNPISFAEFFLFYENVTNVYAADGVCGASIIRLSEFGNAINETIADPANYQAIRSDLSIYSNGVASADYSDPFDSWLLTMRCGSWNDTCIFHHYYLEYGCRTQTNDLVDMTWMVGPAAWVSPTFLMFC